MNIDSGKISGFKKHPTLNVIPMRMSDQNVDRISGFKTLAQKIVSELSDSRAAIDDISFSGLGLYKDAGGVSADCS